MCLSVLRAAIAAADIAPADNDVEEEDREAGDEERRTPNDDEAAEDDRKEGAADPTKPVLAGIRDSSNRKFSFMADATAGDGWGLEGCEWWVRKRGGERLKESQQRVFVSDSGRDQFERVK